MLTPAPSPAPSPSSTPQHSTYTPRSPTRHRLRPTHTTTGLNRIDLPLSRTHEVQIDWKDSAESVDSDDDAERVSNASMALHGVVDDGEDGAPGDGGCQECGAGFGVGAQAAETDGVDDGEGAGLGAGVSIFQAR